MGSYTSVVNDTDYNVSIKYGPNTKALGVLALVTACIGVVAAVITEGVGAIVIIPEVIEFALGIVETGLDLADLTIKSIESTAANEGYHRCSPRGTYVSEKLTLSLVHQANVLIYNKADGKTLQLWSGAFTVWTGATANSTKSYKLSDYLGDLDHKVSNVVAQSETTVAAPLVSQYKALVQARA